jgi:hypothetical protein
MSATPAVSHDDAQTPILYRLVPMPEVSSTAKLSRREVVVVLSCVCAPLVWVGLMIWSPAFLQVSERMLKPIGNFIDQTFSADTIPQLFLTLPACLLAVIVVHEFGHLFMGLGMGFTLESIHIGPLAFSPPFKFSFKIEPKSGASGRVLMIPRTTEGLASRAFWFTLAGPLANLLTGSLTLFFFERSQAPNLFAALSLLVGIGNLIPFRKLATISDGKRIAVILRNKSQGERLLALMRLSVDMKNGIKFKDLSPAFVVKATSVKDDSPDTVGAFLCAYGVAVDSEQIERAAVLLETCLEHAPFVSPSVRDALRSDAAVFLARKRKRVDLAEQWMAEISAKPHYPGLQLRVQAAILEAQGNIGGSLSKLSELGTEYRKVHGAFYREYSLRAVKEWREELEKKKMIEDS